MTDKYKCARNLTPSNCLICQLEGVNYCTKCADYMTIEEYEKYTALKYFSRLNDKKL